MTGAWSSQFTTSVVGGLVVFLLLLIPVLVIQYRRYGRLSPLRVLAVSAVCVYAVALVAYTLLPLPSGPDTCGTSGTGARRQLVPFTFVGDIARETAGLGVAATLTSRAALQVIFNVVLFVPLGLLVRRFSGRGLLITTALGLAVSLVIELTQGTAMWGVYDCPYRVADVDDLLANTTGALIGALLAPRLLAWLPRADQLTPLRSQPIPVTRVRRWLGMVTDLGVFVGATAVIGFGLTLLRPLTGFDVSGGSAWAWVPAAVAGVASFGVPALLGSGASWGQRIVWLEPTWAGRPSVPRLLWRAAAVGGTWAASVALGTVIDPEGPGQVVALLLSVPALLSPWVVLGTPRGLSGLLAGARISDARRGEPGTSSG